MEESKEKELNRMEALMLKEDITEEYDYGQAERQVAGWLINHLYDEGFKIVRTNSTD